MCEQHGRPDLVEQRDAGVAVEPLLEREIYQRRELRGIECVERRVAWLTVTRPLRMELGLRPKIEAFGRDKTLLGTAEVAVRDLPL